MVGRCLVQLRAGARMPPQLGGWALTPLSEEQREIQAVAREFAKREIAPYSAKWDRDAFFELRALNSGAMSGWTRADDEQVVVVLGQRQALRDFVTV